MGSSSKEKDKLEIQEIALTIFILFTALFYIKPDTSLTIILFTLTGIFIVTYFFIGLIKFVINQNQDNLLEAIALITLMILIIPNGLNLINSIFRLIGL